MIVKALTTITTIPNFRSISILDLIKGRDSESEQSDPIRVPFDFLLTYETLKTGSTYSQSLRKDMFIVHIKVLYLYHIRTFV